MIVCQWTIILLLFRSVLWFFHLKFMYVSVLPVCMFVHHTCAWCPWRSEEELDPPKLEVQVVVSHYVGAGN